MDRLSGGAGTGPVSGPATVPAVTGEGQLWALLQDLVEREGRDAAAVRLGLSERTIRRTLTDRHLSRRMTEALLKERNQRYREQPAGADEDEPGERGGTRATGGAGAGGDRACGNNWLPGSACWRPS